MNDTFTGWRKSSRSAANGGCVEVAAGWRKSSYSARDGNCVEVSSAGWRKLGHSGSTENCVEVSAAVPVVGVRDTKQYGRGSVLEFPAAAWRVFIADLKKRLIRPLVQAAAETSLGVAPATGRVTCGFEHARPVAAFMPLDDGLAHLDVQPNNRYVAEISTALFIGLFTPEDAHD